MVYETLLIGILLAVLYAEVMDIYPGGIVVPAYMALYLDHPISIILTLAVAVCALLSYRFLSRWVILFGQRRFVMFILLGIIWSQVLMLILPDVFLSATELRVIGWVVPGLLGNNLEKQRPILTLASLFTVMIMTYLAVRVLGFLLAL
jgi:poly-gamma-glutamate biosynthesis protein PgsC/CapC